MKLTIMLLFFALIFMICGTPGVARSTTAASPEASAPDVVVKEFYVWYIHSVSHHVDPFKVGRVTLRKYVTLRFIRAIERKEKEMEAGGYDADFFLEAQQSYPDSPELGDKWIKNMSVAQVVVRGATATAIVSFAFDGKVTRERVSLIKVDGGWKINEVVSRN